MRISRTVWCALVLGAAATACIDRLLPMVASTLAQKEIDAVKDTSPGAFEREVTRERALYQVIPVQPPGGPFPGEPFPEATCDRVEEIPSEDVHARNYRCRVGRLWWLRGGAHGSDGWQLPDPIRCGREGGAPYGAVLHVHRDDAAGVYQFVCDRSEERAYDAEHPGPRHPWAGTNEDDRFAVRVRRASP